MVTQMTEHAGDGAGKEHDRDRDQSPDEAAPRGSETGASRGARPGQSSRQSRSRQGGPGGEMLNDFQRWVIRSSAKNMRREIGGQVRRTFGAGRKEPGDVWETATTEIPPEVGEAPECQWCPICRAARAMRESGPGLSGHLSTAGDVVASAVHEAFKAFESVVDRGTGQPGSSAAPPDQWAAGSDDWAAARDDWAAQHGARVAERGASNGHHIRQEATDAIAAGQATDSEPDVWDAVAQEAASQDSQTDSGTAEPGSGLPDSSQEPGGSD